MPLQPRDESGVSPKEMIWIVYIETDPGSQ